MTTELDKTPKLFGGYIVSVSTNLSWGSQGASSQFKIVEDPENGVIINIPPMGTPVLFPYYETELVTNPDYNEVDNPDVPAFIEVFTLDENDQKVPQTFGNFTPDKPLSTGFLQRATYSEGLSGRTYDIVIQSPATVLDGVQVILNKFNGTGLGGTLTNEVFNLMNVYGHYENIVAGGNYPFGGDWIRAGFGSSGVDDLGFPIRATNDLGQTVNLFDTLVQMTYDPYYSSFGNPIRHGNYAYELDLTELYFAINSRNLWYYRISGDVRDLGSLISEICELLQFDWMAELRPPKDNSVTDNNRIYLRLIDRSTPPTAGVIKNFIANSHESTNGSVISCSYGQELSTATTAKVVLGAPVSRYVDQGIEECVPMWGRATGQGNWQVGPRFPASRLIDADDPDSGLEPHPRAGELMKVFDLYTMENMLDRSFYFPIEIPDYGTYNVTLMELRMLTGKDPRRSWSHFKAFQTQAGYEPNGGTAEQMYTQPWYTDIKITFRDIWMLQGKKVPAVGLAETAWQQQVKRGQDKDRKKFNKFFEGLSKVAESFCKHFMARVPNDFEEATYGLTSSEILGENVRYINSYGDLEAEQYQTSWEIKPDAWAVDPQVGRPDFFSNGRLKSISAFRKTVKANTWGDAFGFQFSAPGAPLPGAMLDNSVNVRDMGDNWTFSRVFSSEQPAPNATPWDEFPGGAPSPIRVPHFNHRTKEFQSVVSNPWGAGPGLKNILGADANILSLDGGPIEEQIYPIPDLPNPPSKNGAAFWVPCDTGSNPLINDDLTTETAGLSVLTKYFFGFWIDPAVYGAPRLYTENIAPGTLIPNPDFDPSQPATGIGGENSRVIQVGDNEEAEGVYKPKVKLKKNFDHMFFEVPPLRALPIGFGIPQQSTKYRYGPWVKVNAPNTSIPNPDYDPDDSDSTPTILSYVAGKTAVEFDDSLAPETFGGYGGMNQAGFINTDIDTGRVAVDETGYLELVGVPAYNIGDRFEDAGPYVTDLDISVGTDGIKHTYRFNTWTPQRGKLAKYNISILQRIGKSSFNNILAAQNTADLMPSAGPLVVPKGMVVTKQMMDNYQRTFRNSMFSFKENEHGDIHAPHMFTGQVYRLPDIDIPVPPSLRLHNKRYAGNFDTSNQGSSGGSAEGGADVAEFSVPDDISSTSSSDTSSDTSSSDTSSSDTSSSDTSSSDTSSSSSYY